MEGQKVRFLEVIPNLTLISVQLLWPTLLTLKKAGGSYVPAAQEITCHFLQDHARVLKLLDFFKNDVGPRVKESF